MTTVKILLLSTAAVVGIGGTSAALTKDKWWPGETSRNADGVSEDGGASPEARPDCQEGTETQNCRTGETTGQDPKAASTVNG